MTREELATLVQHRLDPALAAKPGAVLLSGPATIAPGTFYVMGLNPGGDPQTITASIIDTLAPADGGSCYTDECWNKHCNHEVCEHVVNGRVRPEARVRHQQNMIALAETLGYPTPATLPSANAIFGRSTRLTTLKQQTGVDAWTWWSECWRVHQALLGIVQPAAIITLGYGLNSSAFGFLWHLAGQPTVDRVGDDNRRGGRSFACSLGLGTATLQTQVIGMPHPSYLSPGDRLARHLRALAATEVTA